MTPGLTHMSEAGDPSALPAAGDEEEHTRPEPGREPDRRLRHRWVPITAGWLCLLIGLADVVSAVIPRLQLVHRLHRITPFVPGMLTNVTFTADVIIGLFLLMLSHGLRRRKRRAWQATCLLLTFSVLIHVVHAPYLVPGVVSAILLGGLLFYRDEFYAVGDPVTRWRAAGVFVCLLIADVAIGLTYMLLVRGLAEDYSTWQRIVHTTYGLVGVTGPVKFVPEGRSDFFNILTSSLGVFTVLVTVFVFLRPAKPKGRLTPQDEREIRELLHRHGHRDSLGYFTLRNDKSVIWSPSGKSCVGYRVVAGVMLASGDPIGDPEAWPGAIHAFLDEAARHAWAPAAMGCSELGAEIWCRESGLTALELGDEAVVEVADFSLKGRQMRNVRQMAARVCRQGYAAQVRRLSEVPPDEVERLVRRADSWRGSPTERGFSMALGRVGGPGDDDCVIATATENGVLRGPLPPHEVERQPVGSPRDEVLHGAQDPVFGRGGDDAVSVSGPANAAESHGKTPLGGAAPPGVRPADQPLDLFGGHVREPPDLRDVALPAYPGGHLADVAHLPALEGEVRYLDHCLVAKLEGGQPALPAPDLGA